MSDHKETAKSEMKEHNRSLKALLKSDKPRKPIGQIKFTPKKKYKVKGQPNG